MPVREALTTNTQVVDPEDTVQSAAELMSALDVGLCRLVSMTGSSE